MLTSGEGTVRDVDDQGYPSLFVCVSLCGSSLLVSTNHIQHIVVNPSPNVAVLQLLLDAGADVHAETPERQ